MTTSSALESAEGEDDGVASVVSDPQLWIKLLACLPSFIHGSSPESRPMSAPPLASRYGFASLFALSTPPESHRPPFHLSPTASPASCSAPSSWWGVALHLGHPLGVPALSNFRCSLGVSLFIRSYGVLLSLLCFLRLFAAAALLRRSRGLRVSVLRSTAVPPVISA